ncbi:hypothetical protein AR457_03750 [Streptomyces agglomeratus]|uniref:Uncharacterized protein n=1 Tax=Streptomyces agglomeratus TaxID=285458 RepID=A0A1E5P2H7_9ACTN|nr:DUF6056 family protein [Streptomyces agglomeratus]OEJ23740.1 hypothetical protein AS594_03855 [Streptomyces agglomeratus]OEJ43333.1 hypothetical protein AR457_03750 [Streptomyces agglomeratus]OEJ54749.1 hypothetical protein BGK72_32020 [Streptomyces agglomeratus]OEJ62121.1 hypothetical protein BGM19_32925 [Streptomyces agglomeratus]
MTAAPGVAIPREPVPGGGGPERGSGEDRGLLRSSTTLCTTTLCTTVLCVLLLGLLTAGAYLGRYVRPSADEWCFLPKVRELGVWGMVEKFYVTDNGRIGNGLLVGMYAQFPVAGHQWFALISGALMLAVLWALTAQVLRRAGLAVPRGVPLLVASMITAVFLFATPNTYKTFYWPAASVSHTLAPVLACAAALPLLLARGRRGRIAALAVVLLSGVFMGTLSEEASVVCLVVLAGVVLLGRWVFTDRALVAARWWALTGMAGIAIGTLVLMTSPGGRRRRERFGLETTSMIAPESLKSSLRAYVHILETVFTTWQYAGAVAAGVLLGLLASGREGRSRGPEGRPRGPEGRSPVLLPVRPLLWTAFGALAFLVSGYLCTVITYPVFGARVVTAQRTWNDYLLLYVVLLAGAGAFLGRALRRRAWRTGVATAAAATVCAVTVAGLAVPLHDLGHDMRVRAQMWERQDQYLRGQAAKGARTAPYTPLSVAGTLEPFSGKGRNSWPAGCVADYYHLDRVTYSTRLP